MDTVESDTERCHLMNPAYLLLFGLLITPAPLALQYAIIAATLPDGSFGGMGPAMVFWGSVFVGTMLTTLCLALWMCNRSPSRIGGAYARAAIVGLAIGAIGAYPLGCLNASTTLAHDLGVGTSLSVALTGSYLAIMFGGYMLLWERLEARRGAQDPASTTHDSIEAHV